MEWALAYSRAVPRAEASQLVEGWVGKRTEYDLLTVDNFHVEYAVQRISGLDQPLMPEGVSTRFFHAAGMDQGTPAIQ